MVLSVTTVPLSGTLYPVFTLDFFVAAVLWVGNLATLGGSGGMPPRKKIVKNNPLNGDYWWDFFFLNGQIETYKISLYITINRFKASAETRSLYKCALNWAETKVIACVHFQLNFLFCLCVTVYSRNGDKLNILYLTHVITSIAYYWNL